MSDSNERNDKKEHTMSDKDESVKKTVKEVLNAKKTEEDKSLEKMNKYNEKRSEEKNEKTASKVTKKELTPLNNKTSDTCCKVKDLMKALCKTANQTLINSLNEKSSMVVKKPDVIMLRLYDVISSWAQTQKNFIENTRNNLMNFLDEYWEADELKQLIEELRAQRANETMRNVKAPKIFKPLQTPKAIKESIAFYMNWKLTKEPQLDIDHVHKAHNRLQRMIWCDSYAKGIIKTNIYSDVYDCLQSWKEKGIKLCLFSCCGNYKIDEKKTLLTQTDQGNIADLFDKFFDTTEYDRHQFNSYQEMAKAMNVDTKNMLFITNHDTEALVTITRSVPTLLITRSDCSFGGHDQEQVQGKIISNLSDIKFAK